VNGKVVRELGTRVEASSARVAVDGAIVKPLRRYYIALHKPVGYLCTRSDDRNRLVVSDLLPAEWSELYPVGRLDLESEGLLFLTNDGDFCLRLTHPRYDVRKKYVATVVGRVEENLVHKFLQGIDNRGETLRALQVRILSANASHSRVELELNEGKNREVRRMFESQGILVEKLQRIQIGPIKLGELPIGKWRVLTAPEVEALRSLSTPGTRRGVNTRPVDRTHVPISTP